jgi:pimeloyl-ACP methyl ester carboxylesterase
MTQRITDMVSLRGARVGLLVALMAAAVAGRSAPADDAPKPAVPPRPLAKIEDYAPPEEFVDAGGVKTHFVMRGPQGPAIVLVHGFASCTYTWRNNMDALAAKGYRVYAIDVKGFGLTEKPRDGKYDLPSFSRHLLDFLDAAKIDRPILVGTSMGGAIVTRLALLHPERVAGVVLIDAAPPNFNLRTAAERVKPAAKDALKAGTPRNPVSLKLQAAMIRTLVTKHTIEAGLRGAYRDPKFVTAEAVEVYFRPLFIEGAAEALIAMTSQPGLSDAALPPLKSLKVPALIVWGRHDRVIPVAMADYFARELPTARKVIFEKSGHMPHEEESDAFNSLLLEFAATVASNPK